MGFNSAFKGLIHFMWFCWL